MENPNKLIYKFNKETGLLEQGYSSSRECAFPIEEMLEGFNLGALANKLQVLDPSPRKISKEIVALATEGAEHYDELEAVDILDKHLDAIVFNFGSIFKLGLTPQEANKALYIVALANMQKLTAGKDSEGKQLKPANFQPPEPQLQKIIDAVDKRIAEATR